MIGKTYVDVRLRKHKRLLCALSSAAFRFLPRAVGFPGDHYDRFEKNSDYDMFLKAMYERLWLSTS